MKRKNKKIIHLLIFWAVISFVFGLSIGLLIPEKDKNQTSIKLFNEAMQYNPQLANWIAEKVYLREISQKEGDKALNHLIEFYKIAVK